MGSSINYVPRVDWLTGKGSNQYTQFGEDGLIEATLEKIGTTNRHCFEIGAADGRFFSNTLRLRDDGWKAVLIEADAGQFARLQEEFGDVAVCMQGRITDLDAALDGTGIAIKPDLGIIDIDGADWWLWHDLRRYRPRVMLVEIYPPDATQPRPERGVDDRMKQAGLDAVAALGTDKGYELVATTYCNALFVDGDEWNL